MNMGQDKVMNELSEILVSCGCSLVVRSAGGDITTYSKKGVRDLIWLIDNEPGRLRGADVADKVVGKAAAGLMVNAGVRSVYAKVISILAVEVLKSASVAFSYDDLTDRITVPEGDTRCRLEDIVEKAENPRQIETMLRKHFEERQLSVINTKK